MNNSDRHTRKQIRRLALGISAIMSVVGFGPIATARAADETWAQLKYLLACNHEMREKITSVSYHVEERRKFPLQYQGNDGTSQQLSEYDIVQKGDLRAATRHTIQTFSNGQPTQDFFRRLVVGPAYCISAFGKRGTPGDAAQFLYDSPSNMSAPAKAEVGTCLQIDILAYAFGDGQLQADAPFLSNPALSRWTIATGTSRGAETYELTNYRVDSSSSQAHPRLKWIVDASRGCSIVSATLFKPNGDILSDETAEVQEVASGIFLAKSISARHYGNVRSNSESPPADVIDDQQLIFSDIKVNVEPAEGEFSIASMGLADGSLVDQYQLDGRNSLRGIAANQVVNMDLVPRMMVKYKLPDVIAAGADQSAVGMQPSTNSSTNSKAGPIMAVPSAQLVSPMSVHLRWVAAAVALGAIAITLIVNFLRRRSKT